MPQRPKIAIICTVVRKYAHAQHFIDRFLEGYGWDNRHHRPPMDLVSAYVDQIGENDLAQERSSRFPSMQLYPTVADALTLGTESLAVDGVLLIGEHGEYPYNEKGQHLYPRYELFKEIVAVYRMTGRSAPLTTTEHGESRDVAGLFFVDGTTLPFLPAKNLTFTLMANATRIAAATL